jgi:hypothetical protein
MRKYLIKQIFEIFSERASDSESEPPELQRVTTPSLAPPSYAVWCGSGSASQTLIHSKATRFQLFLTSYAQIK